MTTKSQRYFWIVHFVFLVAACSPQVVAQPNTADIQNTAIAIAQTGIVLTQASLPTSTPILTIVYPTPSALPTQLTAPVTLDPVQAEQQDEIKSVIQAYFALRYQALSISPPEDFQVNGFGDLVSNGTEAKDFLVTEIAKLAAERKWRELNGFRYAKYEYFLKYKDIFIDASNQIATISVLEDFTIITERDLELNPAEPNINRGDLTHEIVLHNERGQWEIVSDIYRDSWWLQYRKPGMSTDEILRKINEVLQRLEAMPSATPWPSPTP
jgi:hypothetical protein